MKLLTLILLVVLTFSGCGSKTKEALYAEGVKQLKAANPGAAVVFFKNALEKDANFSDARFQLAKAYAALGKNEQAEKEFTKVLSQNPSRDEVLLELARLKNASGDGAKAFALVEQYLAAHPGSVEGLEAGGISWAVRKNYQEAERYLIQALNADPRRVSTKVELASVTFAAGDLDRSKALLKEVLQAEPRNFRALYLLASVEKGGGNRDGALEQYQKILKFDPDQITAQYKMGLIHLEKSEVHQAETMADELIKKYPKKGEGYRLKGIACFYGKNYREAIAALQNSVKLAPSLEGYHFLGLSYYNTGDLESALSQFRVILDKVPNARQARLMIAQTLLAQKRTDDAVTEIKKVLTADDGDAVAHNLLGTAYMAQGLFDEGMRELNRATKLDPKQVTAHLKKGYFYFSRGKNAEGETELATAVQVAPDVLNSRLLLASYYFRQGKSAKALSVLQSGLTGGKGDAPLYNAIAALHFSSGSTGEGLRALETAKQVDPSFSASYHNLASYYAASGDYQKALRELAALLKNDPHNLRALLGSAVLSEVSGKDADALAYYQKAAATGAPDGALALAGYHQKKGHPEKGLAVLDEALGRDSHTVALLEAKGRLLASQKETRQAIKVFDEVESLDSDKGISLKISAYLAARDAGKAVEQAGRLIAKHPTSAQGYLLLASVYESLNDPNSAAAQARKGLAVDPKSVEARLMLGKLAQSRKDYEKAASYYREALQVKPESVPAQFALAALLDVTGKKKEAASRYQAVLQHSDNYVPALNNLAYLCADGYGRKEEALRLAISAIKLQPGAPGVMDTVGYALLKNDRVADAIPVLERAAALLPADPTVRYHLGLAYHLNGNKEKAREALTKSLSLGECADTAAARTLLTQVRK